MNINPSQVSQIQELCRQNKVKSLFAFGSVTREDFNDNSDIDLVIDIDEKDPFRYTDIYFLIRSQLEEIFKRPIDLLEERAIKNKFFRKELDNSKIKIYGC